MSNFSQQNTYLRIIKFSIFCFIFFFTHQLFAQKFVVGYFPDWLKTTLPASKIQFENLTHIIHSFAWPTSTGEIKYYDGMLDAQLNQKVHAENKKILLAFGGDGNSGGFGPMAIDSAARKNFVNNVFDFLTTHNYDGIDIDWEFPKNEGEKKALTKLVKELRKKFTDSDSTLLITMAVGSSDWSGQHFEFEKLKEFIDWFAMMGYDISGSWSNVSGHNAPLYKNKEDWSWNKGYNYLHSTRSIPNNKLLLGLPFYGKQFDAADIYKTFTGTVKDQKYFEVENKITSGNWDYFWDNIAKVPYLLSKDRTRFITYEDTNSVIEKVKYAINKNVAGVMIWALGQDIVGNNQPLLETIARTISSLTAIQKYDTIVPVASILFNNYPNPFNPTTTIKYTIPSLETLHATSQHATSPLVRLKVYDILGKEIATLVNENLKPGSYKVIFNAQNLSSGVYYYKLQVGNFMQVKKMILLK